MDRLCIEQLRTHCTLGVLPWEQTLEQAILIDYTLVFDAQHTHETLTNTFNYAEISQSINIFCRNHTFQLLETLTHQLADHLIDQFPSDHAILTVHKPYAIPNAGDIHFTTTRQHSMT